MATDRRGVGIVHLDDALAVVDKPAGLGRPRGSRAPWDDAGRRPGGRPGGRIGPGAPRHRPPPRPRHVRPDDRRADRRRPPRACRRDQGAGGPPRIPRARDGPAALALRHDRRAARPRLPQARAPCRGRPGLARGAHPLRGGRAGGRRRAGASPARDRAHPSDPRPLRRDRAPGGGRPPLRRRRRPRPAQAVPPQRTGSGSAIPKPARTWSSAPSFPRTCATHWRERAQASTSYTCPQTVTDPADHAEGPCPVVSPAAHEDRVPEAPAGRVNFNRREMDQMSDFCRESMFARLVRQVF